MTSHYTWGTWPHYLILEVAWDILWTLLSHMALKFGEVTWKVFMIKSLRRAWRCIRCLKSKCIFRLPLMSYWLNLDNFSSNYIISSLLWVFNNILPTFISWWVRKATSLSQQHLVEQGFNTWYKSTTMWKTSWGSFDWETHDNSTTLKRTYVDIKEIFFSAKVWNSFHLFRKKLITSTSRIMLNTNVSCT